jgi:soluble lytic murein transglycosylase-like protein
MNIRYLISTVVFAAVLAIGLPPQAARADYSAAAYLHARNQLHPPPVAADVLPMAQRDPSVVAGKYVEMSAKVGGVLTVDGKRTVLLTCGDVSLAVKVPAEIDTSVWMNSGESIRALVYVSRVGNETALADVQLITAAPEYAVADFERREAAGQTRAVSARRASYSSRHGSYGRMSDDELRLAENVTPPAALSARARGIFGYYYAFVRNYNPRLTDSDAFLIAESIVYYSDVNDVDPRLVVAMIIAESDFNMYETSRTGAMGLGQLMPETARGLGVTNAFNPVENIGAAVHILRGHLDTYGGAPQNAGPIPFDQIALTMAAYNAGPGAVRKYHGVPPYRETRRYVARVTALYRALCGDG